MIFGHQNTKKIKLPKWNEPNIWPKKEKEKMEWIQHKIVNIISGGRMATQGSVDEWKYFMYEWNFTNCLWSTKWNQPIEESSEFNEKWGPCGFFQRYWRYYFDSHTIFNLNFLFISNWMVITELTIRCLIKLVKRSNNLN